jgi:hypothetical protein
MGVLAALLCSNLVVAAELADIEKDWAAQDHPKSADQAYLSQNWKRRQQRLKQLVGKPIVFLENTEFGNAPRLNMSLSDGPYDGKPFKAGAAIRVLRIGSDGQVSVDDLLRDSKGMIRDLDVSHDGKRILFSWKKSQRNDDFHLYEMTVATKQIRQVTKEPGVADIQARYLSGDRIVYHSTRCVNVVDCNESIDVVNLYTCDLNGGKILRLGFDQVSTQFPSVLADGRVIFTRWDYNDRKRGQEEICCISSFPHNFRRSSSSSIRCFNIFSARVTLLLTPI